MNIIEPIECTAIDGWCMFNAPNSDGKTSCQVCKQPNPNELKPIKPELEPIEREEPNEPTELSETAELEPIQPNEPELEREPIALSLALSLLTEEEIKKNRVDPCAKPKLTDKERLYIAMCLSKNLDDKGEFLKGTVTEARKIYGTSSATIFNIWHRYRKTCNELGLGGDYLRKYSKNGKKLHTKEDLLSRIKLVPDDDRRTIRTAACALGIF